MKAALAPGSSSSGGRVPPGTGGTGVKQHNHHSKGDAKRCFVPTECDKIDVNKEHGPGMLGLDENPEMRFHVKPEN